MRRSRQAVAAAFVLTLAAAASVPVLAQTPSRGQPGQTAEVASTVPALKIQANNFRFCKNSKAACSTTNDTNYKAHALVGQKIKWIYKDSACDTAYLCPGHNVTFKHRHSAGDTHVQGAVIYTTVFHNAGTYHYYCTHHKDQGMTARIVVTNS